LPQLRNQYRATSAHAGPAFYGDEIGDLSRGLFRLGMMGTPQCIWFDAANFAGSVRGRKRALYRAVRLDSNAIMIEDFAVGCRLSETATSSVPFSPGYGIRLRSRVSAD
jgi:hypothetical protein